VEEVDVPLVLEVVALLDVREEMEEEDIESDIGSYL
jgi:hypothetical protein